MSARARVRVHECARARVCKMMVGERDIRLGLRTGEKTSYKKDK